MSRITDLNNDEIKRAIELYIRKKLGELSENGNTVEITYIIDKEIIGKNMLYHEWKDHILPLPEGYDKVKITHTFTNELNKKKIERRECLDLKTGREHAQYTSNLPMLDEDYWQV